MVMNVLFDTSAFYKRYSGEQGADRVLQLQMGARQVTMAAHCKMEIASALTRQWREGLFTDAEYSRMLTEIDRDFAELTVMPLTTHVEQRAIAALRQATLRAVDALHIGTAQIAGVSLFVTADRRQALAAQAVGLNTELIEV